MDPKQEIVKFGRERFLPHAEQTINLCKYMQNNVNGIGFLAPGARCAGSQRKGRDRFILIINVG